jgi:hypothetical protein
LNLAFNGMAFKILQRSISYFASCFVDNGFGRSEAVAIRARQKIEIVNRKKKATMISS